MQKNAKNGTFFWKEQMLNPAKNRSFAHFFGKEQVICTQKIKRNLYFLYVFSFFWDCSEGMSNYEQIAQVTHQKWVNEQIVHFFANSSFAHFFSKKWAICSEIWFEQIPNPGPAALPITDKIVNLD